MEGTEGMSSGIRVKVNEAPETYQEPARTENPSQLVGSTAAASSSSPITVPLPGTDVKKKRGRLRKYALDGSTATALSPMPISSWIPLTGEISDWKLGKERPLKSLKKQRKCDSESAGVRTAYSVGANFTPHVITVNAGEDVGMKLLSLSQQGSRAICILSANGTISNVTLHQPNSLGGTVTYEGRFELLSLMGSFMPTENGETRSQSGGMSVSLAGSDGCIIGGGISGLLVAAGPVQVVVASFLTGHQQEQKPKKHRFEHVSIPTSINFNPIPREETEGAQGEQNRNLIGPPGEIWASFNRIQGSTDPTMDNKMSLPAEGPIQSNCEVSN